MRTPSWRLGILFILLLFASSETAGNAPPDPHPLLILLSNDDGYDAPGLQALVKELQGVGEVIVASPATEQSGKGHSLSLREPIFVKEHRQRSGSSWYAIDAPPATCVRLAVESLLPRRPDIVISGINRGDNLGATVYHAGTVGGAREAAIVGIPALAVSIRGDDAADYAVAAAFIRGLLEQLQQRQMLKPGLFLNVNVPAGQRKGVRIARLSTKPRHDSFEKRISPTGRVYYWANWQQLEDDEEGTDVWAFVRGYITLTPMTLDVTSREGWESFRALQSDAKQ